MENNSNQSASATKNKENPMNQKQQESRQQTLAKAMLEALQQVSGKKYQIIRNGKPVEMEK